MKFFYKLSFSAQVKRVAISFAAIVFLLILGQHQAFGQWKQSFGYSGGSMYNNFLGFAFGTSNYLLISAEAQGTSSPTIDSLFASTDNGQTWIPFSGNGGRQMAAVTNNGVPSLIGTGSFVQPDNSKSGMLAYSTATSLNNPLATWFPDTIEFPHKGQDNYLATTLLAMGTKIFATNGSFGGVYTQAAPGAPWTPDTVGMGVNGTTTYGVGQMIVFGNNIYASTSGGGMMVSTNTGASWSPINTGLTSPAPALYLGPAGATFAISGTSLFAMIPNNNVGFDTVYNFYRLSSDGQSWTLMNSTPLQGGNGGITNFAASSNLLFSTHDSVVNFSNDNGATWQQADEGFPDFGSTFSNITGIQVSGGNLVVGILGLNQIWYRPLTEFVPSAVSSNDNVSLDQGINLTISENPANSSETKIGYSLKDNGPVEVSLVDVLGKSTMLQSGRGSVGQNQVTLDPNKFEPGTYFVKVSADGKTATQKLVIAR